MRYEKLPRDYMAAGVKSDSEDNRHFLGSKRKRGQMSFVCQWQKHSCKIQVF